jgi:hypothetical protein
MLLLYSCRLIGLLKTSWIFYAGYFENVAAFITREEFQRKIIAFMFTFKFSKFFFASGAFDH